MISSEGAKIIGVVEEDGGTHNPEGLDYWKLLDHFKEHKTVKGFADGQTYMNKMDIMS
jgi:glutamate dehydrogenase/leucine dehydrogenase